MKFIYLPILSLFAFSTVSGQELSITPPAATVVTTEAVPIVNTPAPDIMSTELPEAYTVPRLPFSNDGVGVSRVSFYVNFLGGYNLSLASYSGATASGGGLRLQGDMGVKIPIGGNNTVCDNFLSIGVGAASIRFKDKYATLGIADEVKNDYLLGGLWFPVSFTSVNYKFNDDKGLYWTAGANIGYMSVDANGKDITAACNRIAFEPFVSFGYSAIVEPKRGKIAMENLLIGPIISYNPVNVFKTAGSSLNFFSFGVQITAIAMEWN